MKQRYNCLVCNPASEKTLSAALLRIHLKSKHNLSCEEYYYKYELRLESEPTCARPGCDNKVKFRSLAQGFRDYCSKTCKAFHMHLNMSDAEKEERRSRFEKQRKEWSKDERIKEITRKAQSESMKRMRKNPVAARNNAVAVKTTLSRHRLKLAKFRKENGGRTPEEDTLFRLLSETYDCVSPDYRYFKGPGGGIILDITIPDHMINIEIDGWSHERWLRESDIDRDAFLESQGWCVLRFKKEIIETDLDSVLLMIENAIRKTASLR